MLRSVVPLGDGTVGIAQLAERRVVVSVVAGSIPVTHPKAESCADAGDRVRGVRLESYGLDAATFGAHGLEGG